jgi:hypothetical protein
LDLLALRLQSLFITTNTALSLIHVLLEFTVAHALGLTVSTSLLATDLKAETITSNHYEVFLSSVTLYSSVLICIEASQFTESFVQEKAMVVLVSNWLEQSLYKSLHPTVHLTLRSACFAVYVQRRYIFFLRYLFIVTTSFGLTGHHQVYRLL